MTAPKIDSGLLGIVVNQVVVPEILGLIRAHHAKTGELPTAEQIQAQLDLDADVLQAKGTAWLAANPAEPKA